MSSSLGSSARAAVLWGGGFTLLRDVIQFATMLCLVRLLTPQDYGSVALAQSIVGLLSVFSFGTFVTHALQLRDPLQVDWQAHFTAAAVMNVFLFVVTLLAAAALFSTERYGQAALPLAGLSTVLLVEIPATLRNRMLESQHDWTRFRLLLLAGILLGAGAGITLALLGAGVWALVVQVPLFGLPAAIDLFRTGWRPDWSWTWSRYRDTFRFGASRIGAGVAERGRLTTENALLSGTYDFAALGIFTRSVGLATLLVGRLGSVALQSLYPVLTRAEARSAQFRRYAGLVLRAVSWATIGGAMLLALSAEGIVLLIYGRDWVSVVPLLPFAAVGVGLLGVAMAASRLVLANGGVGSALLADAAMALGAVVLAFLLIPFGPKAYLVGLSVNGALAVALTFGMLYLREGITAADVAAALVPAALAGATAVGVVLLARGAVGLEEAPRLRFLVELPLFAFAYMTVLRLGFERSLRELLAVAPGGGRLGRLLGCGGIRAGAQP